MEKITGVMDIDECGHRQDFNVKILSFRQSGMVQTGFWNLSGVQLIRTQTELESYLYKSITEKTFTISLKIVCILLFNIN